MDKQNAMTSESLTLKSISAEDATHQLPDKEKGVSPKANFEDAITACGYGKFHYFVLLALIPSCWAQVYSSVTIAYIIPIAECDLELTNNNKGALNAASYIGLTMGAFFGGFASDVFGRRKSIFYGNLADFIFNASSSFSFSYWFLFLIKICAGFSISGQVGSCFSYAAETHNNEKRFRIIMIFGAISALAQGLHPVLAYFIIPLDFRFDIIPGFLNFSSWRLFAFICALPSMFAAVTICFLPESPKFLMSKGRTNEALEIFKQIYALNTGNSANTYPIHDLETPVDQKTTPTVPNPSKACGAFNVAKNGWRQIKPIFRPPYLTTALVVFTISACALIAVTTIRLWVPQLFATLNEATSLNTTGESTICGLIESVVKDAPTKSELAQEGHVCPPVGGDVYLRSFIINVLGAVSYLFTTPIVGLMGKKKFAKVCFPIAGLVAISINWVTNKDVFMVLLAVYIALVRNCFSAMSTICVDLFPTAFRSMAMSLILMFGRLASAMGNLLFPIILSLSCGAVFFSFAGILKLASVLVWFIPNETDDL